MKLSENQIETADNSEIDYVAIARREMEEDAERNLKDMDKTLGYPCDVKRAFEKRGMIHSQRIDELLEGTSGD